MISAVHDDGGYNRAAIQSYGKPYALLTPLVV